ncbi:MAG: serine hydrolase, partial [Flavobacteriales bacterium]|nr:serine hydrolase [Flavobacteriales bacterium]
MLRISIAVLVAFMLGATLTFVIIKSTLDSKPITADSTKTIATTAFVSNPLTNPYLATTSARHLYWKPIADFTPQIKTYIDSMVSMHKGIRISYYFRDLTNAVTININPDELYSPASIMKLPIMLAVFRREEASPGFLKRSIPYKAEKMGNVYNPDCAPLVDNQLYSIETLLKRMVQESDNVSTFMLLDEVGIHQVKAVERSMNIELEIDAQAEDDRLTIAQCAS